MNPDRKSELLAALLWAGVILALALAATAARKAGYIEADIATRIVIATIGLSVVWQGNRMPKAFVSGACARQARRVGGWAMTLSGLVYAGLYAFAPLDIAFVYGCGAIAVGMVVMLGYCAALRGKADAGA